MTLSAQRRRVVERRADRRVQAYKGALDGCVCEAEELLDVRAREDGSREFLVKWRDRGFSSWEPEHEFITSHLIDRLVAGDENAESPKPGRRADEQTEHSRNRHAAADETASPAASPRHRSTGEEDEGRVDTREDADYCEGSSSASSRKPKAKRRLQLDSSSSLRGTAIRDKRAIHDDAYTDNEAGCLSTTTSSSLSDNAAEPPAGVLLTPALVARLVEQDEFEDVMTDCFVWRVIAKGQQPVLATVVDFARHSGVEYAFAGRWTDICMIVQDIDGSVQPMRFVDMCERPLTQEQINEYRTAALDPDDNSGKWTEEWVVAKISQLVNFLKH